MSAPLASVKNRVGYIGGSDGPALWAHYELGEKLYGKDASDIYDVFTGAAEGFEGNYYTERGNEEEGGILDALEAVVGPIIRNPAPIFAKTWPWLRVHLDGRGVNNDRMLAEAKWTSKVDTTLEERPWRFDIQMQLQMLCVADAEGGKVEDLRSVLGLKVRNRAPQFAVVEPDPVIIAKLTKILDTFGEAVRKRQRPQPIVETCDDVVVEANDEALALYRRLREVQSEKDNLEAEEKLLRQGIADFLGECDVLAFEGKTLATNRLAKPRVSFDSKAFKAEHADLFAEFSSVGEPERQFRLARREKR